MSNQLPFIDLTSATVGSSGKVQFPLPGLVAGNELCHVRIMNESGCGLSITFSDGSDDFIPAGAWPVFEVEPTVTGFSYSVTYVIPNAPVSQLQVIYYYPGEPVPENMVLGNSPIGITGSVQTSSVQTLSNENSSVPTLVIDIGNATTPQLIKIYNDGTFTWSVSGHTLLQGSVANLLQLGQTGDTSTVLGALTVTQLLTALASLSITGTLTASGKLSTDAATLTSDGSGNLSVVSLNIGGQKVTWLSSSKLQLQSATTEVDLLDNANNQMFVVNESQSAAAPVTNTSAATISKMFFNIGAIKDINGSTATTCGSGTTISHGLSGTPSLLVATPSITQAGSATVGIGSITSTTFKATVGAGSAISWIASR